MNAFCVCVLCVCLSVCVQAALETHTLEELQRANAELEQKLSEQHELVMRLNTAQHHQQQTYTVRRCVCVCLSLCVCHFVFFCVFVRTFAYVCLFMLLPLISVHVCVCVSVCA